MKKTRRVCILTPAGGWSRTSDPMSAKDAEKLIKMVNENFPCLGAFLKIKEGNKIVN